MTDQERCIDALRKISGNTDPGITFPGLLANALEKLAEGGDEPPVQEVFVVEYRISDYDPTYIECDISYDTIREKINELGPNNVVGICDNNIYRLRNIPIGEDDIRFACELPDVKLEIKHLSTSGYGVPARISYTYTGPIDYYDAYTNITTSTAEEIYRKYRLNNGISSIRSAPLGEWKNYSYSADIIIISMEHRSNYIYMTYATHGHSTIQHGEIHAHPTDYFTINR